MAAKVLVVDDHAGFRVAARALLEEMGLDVIGEAESGESALELFEQFLPEIVLLDIQLPGMDGIDVARKVFEAGHSPVIVLTSSREAEDYGARLRALSGAVFIGKTDLSSAALSAVIGETA